MSSASYSLSYAMKNFFKEKWINVLSILSIAASLLLLVIVFIAAYNLEIFSSRLPERFSVIAYLKDGVSKEQTQKLLADLKGRPEVSDLKYISREEAFSDLKRMLKDAGPILEGLDDNPLSASVEVKLSREALGSLTIKNFAEALKKMEGVDEVHYGEKIAETINILKSSFRNIGIGIFFAVFAGVIFITHSTVTILFYRRKEEIDTLKLLGATAGFIRMPFLAEGSALGFLGGLLGGAGAYGLHLALSSRLGEYIPLVSSLIVPPEAFLALPVLGLILGFVGATIATGRVRF